jgi:hypothetical protein
MLELSTSNDQKIAKIIELPPQQFPLANRVDEQATAMAPPSSTDAVLEGTKGLREDDT